MHDWAYSRRLYALPALSPLLPNKYCDMEKVCTKCGLVKSVNQFYKGRADCTECSKSYRRERYQVTKNYYNTLGGWVNQILANKRLYCKRYDLLYDLKLQSGYCEITGISFEQNKGNRSPFGPSIDRIDPKKGYTKDNCRVVVSCYNLAKSNWSDDDVLRMAQAIVSKHAVSILFVNDHKTKRT